MPPQMYCVNELIAHCGANNVVSCLSKLCITAHLTIQVVFGGLTIAADKIKIIVIWFFQDLIRKRVYSRIGFHA